MVVQVQMEDGGYQIPQYDHMPPTAMELKKEGTPLKRFNSSMRIEVEFNRSSNNLPTYVEEESETKISTAKKVYNA